MAIESKRGSSSGSGVLFQYSEGAPYALQELEQYSESELASWMSLKQSPSGANRAQNEGATRQDQPSICLSQEQCPQS